MAIEGVSLGDVEPADAPNPDVVPDTGAAEGMADDGDSEFQDEGGPAQAGELSDEEPGDEDAGDSSDPEGGEDEDGESPPEPALPEGFTSWDEVKKFAAQAPQLRAAQEYARQAAAFIQQQGLLRQQQAPQPAPAAWSPPYADDPSVVTAFEAVRGAPEPNKALATLDPDLQKKVMALDSSVTRRWSKYQLDPRQLVIDYVVPLLEQALTPQLRSMREELHALQGRDFLTKNASVIQSDEDVAAVKQLLQEGVPQSHALRLIAAEKKAKSLEAGKAKVDERSRSQQSAKAKNRANQAAKRGSGRSGVPGVDVKPGMSVMDIFRQVRKASGSP